MSRLLTEEELADLMNEIAPDEVAHLAIRVRNLQDTKTLKAVGERLLHSPAEEHYTIIHSLLNGEMPEGRK